MENYKQNFEFEKRLYFTSESWVIHKGPIIKNDNIKLQIKVINQLGTETDLIQFAFGFCKLDFKQNRMNFNNAWLFSSGSSSFFLSSMMRFGGEVVKINDVITLNLENSEMSLIVNEEDHGIIFPYVGNNVCFAVLTKGSLEIEILNVKDKSIVEILRNGKLNDFNFNFE